MKIERTLAVAFLVALGFPKAAEWPDDKMKDRLLQVPTRVDEDKVPKDHLALYKKLSAEDPATVKLEIIGEAGEDEQAANLNKKPKAGAKKPAAKPVAKPKKADVAAPAKEDKLSEKPRAEKTQAGPRAGSIRAKVSKTLTPDWQGETEIAALAGVEDRQARLRLRRLKRDGLIEHRRLVQYRLVTPAPGAKKKADKS